MKRSIYTLTFTFVSILILIVCSIAVVAGGAQTQQTAGAAPQGKPAETYKVQVGMVPVFVSVTGKDHKPVTGLKKEDFQVLDDGVIQDLKYFEEVALSAQVPAAGETVVPRRVPTLEISKPTRRTILIILGNNCLLDPFNSINDLAKYVRRSLLPQDQVAVMAFNRATHFTSDHEYIARVIEQYRDRHKKVDWYVWKLSQGNGLAAIYGSNQLPADIQKEVDAIFSVPGYTQLPWTSAALNPVSEELKRVRRNAATSFLDDEMDILPLPFFIRSPGGGWTMVRTPPSSLDLLNRDLGTSTDLSLQGYAQFSLATGLDVQSIYAALSYLRYVGGQKFLLLFSEYGLLLPRLENDKSLAAMANDAQVTVFTFQTGGMDSWDAQDFFWANSSMRALADWTGGRSSIHSDIPTALGRFEEISRSYYLLGFYPKDLKWDGAYHHLKVITAPPGLTVTCRRGYYADERPKVYDPEAFLSYSRTVAAATSSKDINMVSFKIKPTPEPKPDGQTQTRVSLVIDPKSIVFNNENGGYHGKLYITTFFGDQATGKALGSRWDTLGLSLTEEEYKKVQAEGLQCSTAVAPGVAKPSLKVVVYDAVGDRVGTATYGALPLNKMAKNILSSQNPYSQAKEMYQQSMQEDQALKQKDESRSSGKKK